MIRLLFLALAPLAPAAIPAGPPAAEPSAASAAHAPPAAAAAPVTGADFLRLGEDYAHRGVFVYAEIAFRHALTAPGATPAFQRQALLALARFYRDGSEFTKAAATYEKLLEVFPNDDQGPLIYLELGRTLRAMGAYRSALNRFYSVINATLKVPAGDFSHYRQLAMTAQFEIAQTCFESGDYLRASRYFSRLDLLDLAPADRARAAFRSADALFLAGQSDGAVRGLRSYLRQFPNADDAPEARYLLSLALRRLGRNDEALAATLDLLRAEHAASAADPTRWAYWQRKTGNQLANSFYDEGDIASALVIYQRLAALAPDPAWRLPADYQLGLCYERLRQTDRARAAYASVGDDFRQLPAANRPTELAEIARLAAWRLTQLAWLQNTEQALSVLLPAPAAAVASNVSATPAHDPDGSPAKPSASLR